MLIIHMLVAMYIYIYMYIDCARIAIISLIGITMINMVAFTI